MAGKICAHSATRALMRSDTDVGRESLALNQHFSSSQKVQFSGVDCVGQIWQTMTSRTCHGGTSLGLLIAVKGNLNATAYEDILDNCVLPNLWQEFREDPHMDMMVYCQHTFGQIVYHTGLTTMYRPTPKQNTGMESNYSTTTPAYTTAHNSAKEDIFRCEKSYNGESLLLCIIITLFASIFLILIMSITWLKTYQTMKRRIRSLQDTQQQAIFLPSAEADPSEKSSGPKQIIPAQLEQNAISASEFNLQSMKSASSSFNKANLMMHQLIKAGKEGMLYKAKTTQGAIKGHTMFTCKIYKRTAKHKLVKREVMIMRTLNTHTNLLQLVDWNITEVPYMLIMENVEHGSLHTYLKANKESLCKQEELQHLFTIALYHIAQAMDYLHSKMILHCNLALRNVMVHSFPHEVKVAEFGLARDITRDSRLSGSCENTDSKRIPFRWYPPEYFKDNLYEFKGDVWAFGIVIWEMQTFGTVPYPDLKTSEEVVSYVCAGHRTREPEECRPEMLQMMRDCWQDPYITRPSFMDIVTVLENILETDRDYVDMDTSIVIVSVESADAD